MLADRSEGFRREITGITTLEEAKDALAMLTLHGVTDSAEIHGYLHTGWTGEGPDDPEGRTTSLALWARAETEYRSDE